MTTPIAQSLYLVLQVQGPGVLNVVGIAPTIEEAAKLLEDKVRARITAVAGQHIAGAAPGGVAVPMAPPRFFFLLHVHAVAAVLPDDPVKLQEFIASLGNTTRLAEALTVAGQAHVEAVMSGLRAPQPKATEQSVLPGGSDRYKVQSQQLHDPDQLLNTQPKEK